MSEPTLLTEMEVDTYLSAVDWLTMLLARDEIAQAWNEPSALSRYTTGGVAAHGVYAGVIRPVQLLGAPEPAGDHHVKVADYFGPNRVEEPEDDDPLFTMLREGAEKTARKGVARLLATCQAARAELAEVLPMTPSDRAVAVARIPGGSSSASDYLRTRVLEVVVHGDDLVASVEGFQAPDPPPAAMDVCLALCVELARAQPGDVGALRAFTRAERADPGALRVL